MKSNLTLWAATYHVTFSLHPSFLNFSMYTKGNDIKYSSYLAVEIIMAVTHFTYQNVSRPHLKVSVGHAFDGSGLHREKPVSNCLNYITAF
jgi:hypothetical protein